MTRHVGVIRGTAPQCESTGTTFIPLKEQQLPHRHYFHFPVPNAPAIVMMKGLVVVSFAVTFIAPLRWGLEHCDSRCDFVQACLSLSKLSKFAVGSPAEGVDVGTIGEH